MVVSVKTALLLLASSAVFPSLTQAQVRVLYQNDLSGNSEASSALLVYPDSSSTTKDPTALCGGYNEQLLSDADATSETGGVKDQLNYLVFRGDLKSGSQVFIADSSSSSSSAKERRTLRYERNNAGGKKCKALTVGTCDVKEVPCWQHLVSRRRSAFRCLRGRRERERETHTHMTGHPTELWNTLPPLLSPRFPLPPNNIVPTIAMPRAHSPRSAPTLHLPTPSPTPPHRLVATCLPLPSQRSSRSLGTEMLDPYASWASPSPSHRSRV